MCLMTNILNTKMKVMKNKQYRKSNRPYLHDMIDHFRTPGSWKIHLTMKINLTTSEDSNQKRLRYFKSDNRQIMIGNEINETIGDIFNSLLHRYEINLEKSIQGSKFVFDYVDTSFYKSHKISLNRARSYLDPSE